MAKNDKKVGVKLVKLSVFCKKKWSKSEQKVKSETFQNVKGVQLEIMRFKVEILGKTQNFDIKSNI